MITERTESERIEAKIDRQFDKLDARLENLRTDLKGDMRWFTGIAIAVISLVMTICTLVLSYIIKHP